MVNRLDQSVHDVHGGSPEIYDSEKTLAEPEVHEPTPAKQKKKRFFKWLKEKLDWSATILKVVQATAALFACFYKLAATIKFVLGITKLPKSFSSLFSIGKNLPWLKSLNRSLDAKLDVVDRAQTNKNRAKSLREALEFLEEQGVSSLRKKLGFSKKANLVERVDRLKVALAKSRNKATIEEALEFLKKLSTRIRHLRNYELIEAVVTVATVAADIFALFTPLTVISAVILLTTTLTSLVLMAGRAMFIHKNPFDDHKRSNEESRIDESSRFAKESSKKEPSTMEEQLLWQKRGPEPLAIRTSFRKRFRPLAHWNLRLRIRPLAVAV